MEGAGTGRWALRALRGALVVSALLVCLQAGAVAKGVGFRAYDDEGYVLQTVAAFVHGSALYDQVHTSYGPVPYLYRAVLHGLGMPLTHDATRCLTFAEFALGLAGLAALLLRATQRAGLTAVGLLAALPWVFAVFSEPGHPQGLALVLTTVALGLLPWRGAPHRARWLALGATLGALAATKVNLGAFSILGVSVPLLVASRSPPLVALGSALALATLLLPVTLVRARLGVDTTRLLCLTTTAGIFATLAWLPGSHGAPWWRRAHGSRRAPSQEPDLARPAAAWLAAGLCAGTGLGGVFALATGTSLEGLVRGTVLDPAKHPGVFHMPMLPARPWELAATGAAFVVALPGALALRDRAWGLAAIKAAASALLLGKPAGVTGLVYLGPALAWTLLLPTPDDRPARAGSRRLARAALALFATLNALVVYPVYGSQLSWSTLPFLVVGVVLAHDALRTAAARAPRAAPILALAVVLGLAARLASDSVARRPPALGGPDETRLWWPLNLPGAREVFVPTSGAGTLRWVTANLRAHADMTFSDPGMASFSLWSGVPLPEPGQQVTNWHHVLSDEVQERQRRRLEAAARPVIVRQGTSRWTQGAPDDSGRPLVRYLREECVPWRTRGPIALLVPRRLARLAATWDEVLLEGPLPVEEVRDAAAVLVPPLLERPGTIEVWWRSARPAVLLGLLAGDRDAAPVASRPLIYVGVDGRLRSTFGRPPSTALASSERVDDGAWHHAVVRTRAGVVSLFLDGHLVDSSPEEAVLPSIPTALAGAGWAAGWPDAPPGWSAVSGELGRIAVRPEALDDEEVRRRAAGGPPRRHAGGAR